MTNSLLISLIDEVIIKFEVRKRRFTDFWSDELHSIYCFTKILLVPSFFNLIQCTNSDPFPVMVLLVVQNLLKC